MDINAHLKQIIQQRGWSEYRLAKECGLSESTIANIFRRNCTPSFSTLEIICKALGVSLSQFFVEDNIVALTSEEKALIDKWAMLTPEQKGIFLQVLELLCKAGDKSMT